MRLARIVARWLVFLHAISGRTVSVLVFLLLCNTEPDQLSAVFLSVSKLRFETGRRGAGSSWAFHDASDTTITRNGCAAKTESRRWSSIGSRRGSGGVAVAVASPPLPTGICSEVCNNTQYCDFLDSMDKARVLVEALDSPVPVL